MLDDKLMSAPADRLVTLAGVQALIPLSASSVYRLMKTGEFPSQVRIGRNRVAWRHRDIIAWIAERSSTVSPSKRRMAETLP